MKGVVWMFCLYLPFFALSRFFTGAVAAIKRVDFGSQITNILTPAAFLSALVIVGCDTYGRLRCDCRPLSIDVRRHRCFDLVSFASSPDRHQEAGEAGHFKGYFALSLPLFFVGLGYLLMGQMDTIMLGYFVDTKEVGIYSVAVRISAFVLLGLEIVLPIVGPFWAQFSESNDLLSTKVLFGTVTKWISQAGLIIFAFIIVFRVELLRVFGKGLRTRRHRGLDPLSGTTRKCGHWTDRPNPVHDWETATRGHKHRRDGDYQFLPQPLPHSEARN